MHGLPLLHAGVPVPGALLRVEPAACRRCASATCATSARARASRRPAPKPARWAPPYAATATSCWPKRTSASPRSRREYYQQDLRRAGSGRHQRALPFRRAVRADRAAHECAPWKPLPETTWRVLELVPDVVSTGTVLLGGIWWITNRREEVAKSGGPPQMKLNFRKLTVWRAIFAAIMLSGAVCHLPARSSMGWAARPTSATSSPGASGSAST